MTAKVDFLKVRIAVIAVHVAVLSYLYRNAQIDDAFIYARYIRNALGGFGLVFNPGEHVNSLSAPLYSYMVLGAAKMLHGQVLLATVVVSGVFLFLLCALAESLYAYAGLLLAGTGYFYLLVGMETSAFLFLLLLNVVLIERERYDWLPSACVLLVLTRMEAVAFLLPLGLLLYRRRRWPTVVAFLPAVVMGALYLGLNHHWYGAFLPASAGAKLGQGRSEMWGDWPTSFFRSAFQLKPVFLPTLYVVVLVVVLAPWGAWRLRGSAMNAVLLPFLAILFAFYVVFNIPGYKWYYAPFIAFAMVYAGAAVQGAGRWRWLAVPVVLCSAMTAGHRSFVIANEYAQHEDYPAIGRWLAAHTVVGTRVAAGETGSLGWYCAGCNVIDILGLTLPKNAEHIAHRDITSWLAEDDPQYVVVHKQDWIVERVAKQSLEFERVPVEFGGTNYLLVRKVGR